MITIGGTDLETTGFFEPAHRIIEACVIRYEFDPATKRLRELDAFTQRINPERAIDAKAREVHGIHDSDLVGKPNFKSAAPELFKKLDSCDFVVAHNGFDFDFPFLIMEFERVGHPIPDFNPIDSMIEGRWATPFGKAPSLQELCFASGVEYDPSQAHAAEYDVRRMMECFSFGLNRGVFSLSTN